MNQAMIRVLRSGIHCTVQDRGRYGYRDIGVPVSGWMDAYSASLANLLLDNDPDDAVIEMGLMGLKLEFRTNTWVIISGAPKRILMNDHEKEVNQVIKVSNGDQLDIKSGGTGVWTYLAVKGGIQNEKVLNSRSSYIKANIGESNLLQGNTLTISKYDGNDNLQKSSTAHLPPDLYHRPIRVVKGPEYKYLSKTQKQYILEADLTIGQKSDRMAYYIEGAENELSGMRGIVTSVVAPGTIQLPPSGVPMVLMRDAQTTGGYARIFQVMPDDISILSQKRTGEKVKIVLV